MSRTAATAAPSRTAMPFTREQLVTAAAFARDTAAVERWLETATAEQRERAAYRASHMALVVAVTDGPEAAEYALFFQLRDRILRAAR